MEKQAFITHSESENVVYISAHSRGCNSFSEEVEQVFTAIKEKARELNTNTQYTLKNYIQITDIDLAGEKNEIYPKFYKEELNPSRITVAINALPDDANISVLSEIAKTDNKSVHNSKHEPFLAPVYAVANIYDEVLYLSGQVSVHYETDEILKANFKEEAETILFDIKLLLEEANTAIENIVHLNIKVSDAKYAEEYALIHKEFFKNIPIVCTISVAQMWDNLALEISAVACMGGEDKDSHISKTADEEKVVGISAKNCVYIKPQFGGDKHSELHASLQSAANALKNDLRELGIAAEKVLTLEIYSVEENDTEINSFCEKAFKGNLPCISVVYVKENVNGAKVMLSVKASK